MSALLVGAAQRKAVGHYRIASAFPQVCGFKRPDVLPTVDASHADLEVGWPLASPPPGLKRALTEAPAGGELFLRQMVIFVHREQPSLAARKSSSIREGLSSATNTDGQAGYLSVLMEVRYPRVLQRPTRHRPSDAGQSLQEQRVRTSRGRVARSMTIERFSHRERSPAPAHPAGERRGIMMAKDHHI